MNIPRTLPILFATVLFAAMSMTVNAADDKGKGKDKAPEKPKVFTWDEVRTAHFIVASDGGEKTARRVADQFEQLRSAFQSALPNARVDNGIPILILAAKDGKSFATVFTEFPVDKKREQPVGMFLPGEERAHIALRTNVSGQVPYQDIYRGYARQVLKLSYRDLPPWLELGYASLFENMSVGDKGAAPGRLTPEDLSALFASPLLPLDIVFHVDRNSGYYRSGGETTVFSAESRALVHFLVTDPQMSREKLLDHYIGLVQGGTDSLVAARQTFGDLEQLRNKLEAYFKRSTSGRAESSEVGDAHTEAVLSSHTLSPAELAARLGDFEFARGHFDAAQTKLEDAIKMDPAMAFAQESMGFLLLQQSQAEEAEKHFQRAAELDPKSALTYYGLAMAAMARNGATGVAPGSVANFEKVVALDPEFAAAWFNLATLYSLRPETMSKALPAAERAAALAPGETGYQNQVADIQARLGNKNAGATLTAQRAGNATDISPSNVQNNAQRPGSAAIGNTGPASGPQVASSPGTQVPARSAPQVPTTTETPSRPVSDERATERASDAGIRIQRKTEPDDQPTIRARRPDPTESQPPEPLPPPAASTSRVYSMIGMITDVICKDAPQVMLTLKAATIVMHLHAADISHLSITPSGGASPAKGPSCAGLRGRNARVSYQIVSEKSWDGEIQVIEFRNQP